VITGATPHGQGLVFDAVTEASSINRFSELIPCMSRSRVRKWGHSGTFLRASPRRAYRSCYEKGNVSAPGIRTSKTLSRSKASWRARDVHARRPPGSRSAWGAKTYSYQVRPARISPQPSAKTPLYFRIFTETGLGSFLARSEFDASDQLKNAP
jgi:hypothetical protein